MSCSFRRALTLVVSAAVLASLVPAAALAAPSSGTAVRPSVAIVTCHSMRRDYRFEPKPFRLPAAEFRCMEGRSERGEV